MKYSNMKNTSMAGRRNSKEKRRCKNTYKRLLTTNYKDTQAHRLTLTKDSYDLELFEEQVNFLSIVMEYTLQTVKGKDLVRRYPTNPVQLWKTLLFHHKGSNTSTDTASKLLWRLIDIWISHFASKALFLHEFATIIDYYNHVHHCCSLSFRFMYSIILKNWVHEFCLYFPPFISST